MQTKTITYPIAKAKAPSHEGIFQATVAETWPADAPKDRADSQGDIFATGAFDDQDGELVPVAYAHLIRSDGQGGFLLTDPGAVVGNGVLRPSDDGPLYMNGRLSIGKNKMADAIFERMLLPASDPQALKEFSVGYSYDDAYVYRRSDGVRVLRKARVEEVSVVWKGAQRTELLHIKTAPAPTPTKETDADFLKRVPAGRRAGRVSGPLPAMSESAWKAALLRKFGDTDDIREALALETRASQDAKAAAERMQRARVDLAMRSSALNQAGPERVLFDKRFRVLEDGDSQRDAERAACDRAEIEHRERERARELAEVERIEALPIEDETRRFEGSRAL